MDINTSELDCLVQKYEELLTSTADTLWDYAETAYQEIKSCTLLKKHLCSHGFTLLPTSPQLPTAFAAKYGSGRPVIGLLGEYDALPDMAHPADCYLPTEPTSCLTSAGHGCGHHLLGTGLLAAALFLKDLMDKYQLPGTIIYFGCPAEENEAGKSQMLAQGFFRDVDAAFSWHPHAQSGIFNQSLANQRVSYTFTGTSAHASLAPHLGRSALDACELMNIGVNYLREHMPDDARIHYAYLNAGGKLPNIVPAKAQLLYAIRSPQSREAAELRKRVDRIAAGAALMTDTKVDIQTRCIYDSLLPNPSLDRLLLKYMKTFSPAIYTPEEVSYAAQAEKVLGNPACDMPLCTLPDLSLTRKTGISTDVGNISQKLPCTAFMTACYAKDTPLHHWTAVAQGKSSIAHKGMLTAGKILAASIWELLLSPEIMEHAQKDFLTEKVKRDIA